MTEAGVLPKTGVGSTLTGAEYRIITLASLGSGLEFYEFITYGVFSPYIAANFFPASDPLTSLILTFGVFGVGYLSRPLGGLILAHYGDRRGRRGLFVFSVLAMSISTLIMALLPSYASVGIAAPLMLIALRLVQGACIGGELACAVTYVVEAVPQRRGLVCGILFGTTGAGTILAIGVSVLLQKWLSAAEMQSYGWRLAFIMGSVLGIATYWVRRALQESPEFLRIKSSVHKVPLLFLLSNYRRESLIGIGIAATLATYNGLYFAYMPAYLTKVLDYKPEAASTALLVGLCCYQAGAPLAGWISDLVSRKVFYILVCLVLLVGAVPAYQALVAHSLGLTTAMVLIGLCGAPIAGMFGAILADLFPATIRFSGVALTYGIGSAIFNGLAPLVAAALIKETDMLAAPAFVMAGVCALTIIAAFFLPAEREERSPV
jgi:MHS family proline/betaine transporter-like MFS transporter